MINISPHRMNSLLCSYLIQLLKFSFPDGNDITTAGSLQFDFKAIEAATNCFLPINKLGQGGFGEVYKVLLPLNRAMYSVFPLFPNQISHTLLRKLRCMG